MKGIKYFSLLGLVGSIVLGGLLTSCSNSSSKKAVYGINDNDEVAKLDECELIFKDKSEIPYVSLEDGTKFLNTLRFASLKDDKYKVEYKKVGNEYVLSNEAGGTCTINKDKQTFTYNDYDKFTSIFPDTQKPILITPILSSKKALKVIENTYTPGKEVTFDLNGYSLLDIYEKDGKCYLPLSVYNSVLLNTYMSMNLAYNGTNLFFISGSALSETNLEGEPEETEIAKKFREGAAKTKISEEYLNYYYQSICFDFNCEYGLEGKFTNFEDFLNQYKVKDKILNTDPKQIDNYTAIALTWLNDGHTALTEFSNMYKFRDNRIDETQINPIKKNHDDMDEMYTKAYKEAGIRNGISFAKDKGTVFVTFDKFTNIDEEALYKKKENEDELFPTMDLSFTNTAKIFNDLYKSLKSEEYKGIKNVVVDLTANDGGSAEGLLYALSTLIGTVTVDTVNPRSGGHNKQVFKADINGDEEVNDGDKSLIELGYNIYFLDSQYSFSSANAMPYLAKLNNNKVVTLGAKTAGGPCAVRSYITPIGSVISSSSLCVISKLENGKYVNIDDGIQADYEIDESKLIDRMYILNYIDGLKK